LIGCTETVAALNGQASVDPSRLFPSDDKTQFGDWVKAGALKIGDQVSTRDSIPQASGTTLPGPRLAANDNGVPASGLPLVQTGDIANTCAQTSRTLSCGERREGSDAA
jgi:hypothetical protein